VSEQFWAGDFGKEYTKRNRVQWSQRAPFWQRTLEQMTLWPHNILEVGCNAGWNLNAIRHIDPEINLVGVDVCQDAIIEAEESGHECYLMSAKQLDMLDEKFDLVFTAGVLIHVPPNDMDETMDAIINASQRYVLAVEYPSWEEEEVEYRGHSEKLWRRPFGEYYINKGLDLVSMGDAGPGFDKCGYWLLRKP